MKASIIACAAVGLAGAAHAQEEIPTRPVVVIEYRVAERAPEAVERTVLAPVERVLKTIDGVTALNGTACEGRAVIEVAFRNGAGRNDLGAVAERVEAVRFDPQVKIVARTVGLGEPSPWWTAGRAPAVPPATAGQTPR